MGTRIELVTREVTYFLLLRNFLFIIKEQFYAYSIKKIKQKYENNVIFLYVLFYISL